MNLPEKLDALKDLQKHKEGIVEDLRTAIETLERELFSTGLDVPLHRRLPGGHWLSWGERKGRWRLLLDGKPLVEAKSRPMFEAVGHIEFLLDSAITEAEWLIKMCNRATETIETLLKVIRQPADGVE